MVSQLDDFSSYVPSEQAEALTDRVMGVDRGLGLRLRFDEPEPVLLGPLPDSPAHAAMLFAGDCIVAVDEQPTRGLSEAKIHELLAGELGREVTLSVRDAHTNALRSVVLRREEFPVEAVLGLLRRPNGEWVWRVGPEGVAYVRITEFCPKSAERLRQVLRRLDPMPGLVLDLRDNPGGLLADAVAVADVFLREGVIVRVLGRDRGREIHQAHPDTPHANVPLVVLIDEKTTSAAEIVAGTLAANARAVLVGRRTRGKGCVQTMLRLPGDLGQIQLTTAEFLLPPDRPIQRREGAEAWGVPPQIEVAIPAEDLPALRRRRIESTVVPEPTSRRPATQTSAWEDSASEQRPERELLRLDRQLARAVQLLRRPEEYQAILERLEREKRQAERAYQRKLEAQTRSRLPKDAPTP